MDTSLIKTEVRVRWAVRRDLPAIEQIEADSFGDPMDAEAIRASLRKPNVVVKVAISGPATIVPWTPHEEQRVVGWILFSRRRRDAYKILRVAVAPDCRRRGVASAMVAHVAQRAVRSCRERIYADVPEDCLHAQLALRSLGWRAIRCNTDETYRMEETAGGGRGYRRQ